MSHIFGCRLCLIAGDISPIDVITHVPILCEEADVPYIYVPSKEVSFRTHTSHYLTSLQFQTTIFFVIFFYKTLPERTLCCQISSLEVSFCFNQPLRRYQSSPYSAKIIGLIPADNDESRSSTDLPACIISYLVYLTYISHILHVLM